MTSQAASRLRRLLLALSSIEVIILCLGLAMILIFAGTLAQVDMGTFAAQKRFFNSWVILARTPFGLRLPVLPGGLSVGTLWFASLSASMACRYAFRWKNAGLLLAHGGLMLLLLGQFLTQTFAQESQMAIQLRETLDYTESADDTELAVIQSSDPRFDDVVSIPRSIFGRPGEIRTPLLPFAIVVKRFFPNARLSMAGPSAQPQATQGVGARVVAEEAAPVTSDDEANAVSALVEIKDAARSYGTWLLSSGLGAPQAVHVDGKDYQLYIRQARHYLPFSLTLKDFRHDIYPGTDIPKNFSSLVRLEDQAGERRDALIYMNHPLRYAGLTFYQASFGKGDTLSVLQVVHNPAWITPYVSCAMVVLGLAIHFLMSLQKRSREQA